MAEDTTLVGCPRCGRGWPIDSEQYRSVDEHGHCIVCEVEIERGVQPSTPPEVEGLLPCPFCGGRVEIRHDLAVVCDDCDAAVHLGGDEVERTDGLTVYAEEATAYLWNRRSRLSRRAEPDGVRGWGSCIDPATGLYLVTTRKPQSEETAYTLPVLIGQPQEQGEVMRLMDAMELAWGVIANASGGDWYQQSNDWRLAATRWRDEHWHPALDRNSHAIAPPETESVG